MSDADLPYHLRQELAIMDDKLQRAGWSMELNYLDNDTHHSLDERWTSQAGQDWTIVDIFGR